MKLFSYLYQQKGRYLAEAQLFLPPSSLSIQIYLDWRPLRLYYYIKLWARAYKWINFFNLNYILKVLILVKMTNWGNFNIGTRYIPIWLLFINTYFFHTIPIPLFPLGMFWIGMIFPLVFQNILLRYYTIRTSFIYVVN